MEIASFDVSEDKVVTLHMTNMPPFGVRTSNTTVYIGAVAIGNPESVSGTTKTITFSAREVTESGKIGVMVVLDNDQLDAQSDEDYVYVPKVAPDETMRITGISPRVVSVGGVVTFRGVNLNHLKMVRLRFSNGGKNVSYNITSVRADPSGTTASFNVPAQASKGAYGIGLVNGSGQVAIMSSSVITIG